MARKLQLVLMVGLGLLGVLGGVWWWQQPARVVDRAVRQLAQVPRERFNASVRLTNVEAAKQLLGETSAVTVSLDGSFDREAPGRPSLAAQMSLGAQTESVSLEIAGEVRFIGDQAYVVVNKAPASIPVLAQLKGQWVELPRGEASQPGTPVAHEPLLTQVRRVGRNHYQATGQAAAIVHFMNGLASLLGTQLTSQQVEQLRQNVAGVTTLPVEIKVTGWQHRLKELTATLDTPSGNDVHFTIAFRDPGQPVTIEAPTGAKSLSDALAAAKR